jgi:hypothetical protein
VGDGCTLESRQHRLPRDSIVVLSDSHTSGNTVYRERKHLSKPLIYGFYVRKEGEHLSKQLIYGFYVRKEGEHLSKQLIYGIFTLQEEGSGYCLFLETSIPENDLWGIPQKNR